MNLDFERIRDYLYNFQFQKVFIEELGWEQPSNTKKNYLDIDDKIYYYQRIAEAAKVAIFEVTSETGEIPEGKIRKAIHQEIEQRVAENLLIFLDAEKTRSLWYWVKRDDNKRFVRDHLYVKGQPGDLFLSKLGSLVIDIIEFETESISVVEIAQKLQRGFDVERVTKKFYQEFQDQHSEFLKFIQGIDNLSERRWYTSVLLNRLMFVYFLQRKGFIDGKNLDYLQEKLTASKQRGENQYYHFLQSLFFEGFAKLESERDEAIKELIGEVKYLNGGLFLKHSIEEKYDNISIADTAFIQVLDLFSRYSWNLNDTPEGKDDEINPDVLGYIFEKYINQKEFGAYYTCTEITEYLCDRTINKLILDRINNLANTRFREINELLIKLDAQLCHYLVEDILPNLTLLDPACGSGAFLVAAMKSLISIYTAVIGTIKLNGDRRLKKWLKEKESSHPSLAYFVKKRIITDNLFGVDIMEEATEIAKLRLFLALVSSAQSEAELEPLPNIDFNIMMGNSLIGLIRVNEESFENVGE
ncbi:DNA methyltransferase [Hydrocoleum sp. CS-953]|uniref:DNA methyltransferase n=2 Tax=Hydrocoleum sp. CS-953 TaxID=1671698 RepID=UPI001AEFCC44|nr:DNA methyltransferase [Hydrocoleum sp. CS-953]